MVDKTLVLRKLTELDEYGSQIAEYAGVTIRQYKEDWKVQRIIERTLQMMIETCLDIGGHIIADEGFRTPDSYADMFRILYENDILDSSLLSAMENMAKFRNVIVHQYERVDPEIVISILTKHLSDFEHYRDSVVAYLKSDSKAKK